MSQQNLISASLTPADAAEIQQKLTEIKSKLGFLSTIQPEQKKSFIKVGNTFLPFLEKGYNVVNDHPEILPAVFNTAEFKKDYTLIRDLTPITNMVNELAEGLDATAFAASSDAMVETLEVYSAVEQNKDKVPGLDVVYTEMREFFKKTKKEAKQAVKQ